MEIKKVLVTPKKAEEWLKHNDSNRSLSPATWKHYLKIMKRGEWDECPQPIVRNGRSLLDGQHRLRALVEYGKPITFWVATAASADVRKIVDRGRTRTIADVLRMEYGIKNAGSCSAVAKWCRLLETGITDRLSPEEVLEIVNQRTSSFQWLAANHSKGGRHFRGAFFVGPLVWLHKKYPKEVSTFHHDVCTGEHLQRTDPAMKLRNRIIESATEGYMNGRVLSLTVMTAFENYLDGKDLKLLKPGASAYQRFRRDFRLNQKGGKWAEAALKVHRGRTQVQRRRVSHI